MKVVNTNVSKDLKEQIMHHLEEVYKYKLDRVQTVFMSVTELQSTSILEVEISLIDCNTLVVEKFQYHDLELVLVSGKVMYRVIEKMADLL